MVAEMGLVKEGRKEAREWVVKNRGNHFEWRFT